MDGDVAVRRLRRGFVASATQYGLLAVAALAITLTIVMALAWRADEEAVSMRVDMLGRERALTTWVLAGAERAVVDNGAVSAETMVHLDLLTKSWATVRDGGPELGLDLQPTGRTVRSWEPIATDFADVSAQLSAYREAVIEALAAAPSRDRLPALRTAAADLVGRLIVVVRAAGDDRLHDSGLWWAGSFLALGVASACAGVTVIMVRSRRRGARHEATIDIARQVALKYRALVEELPIPVMILGESGVVVANDAAAALLGVSSPDDLVGIDVRSFLASSGSTPPQRDELFALHGNATETFEVSVDLPTGEHSLELHARVIPFEGGLATMLAAVDITARRAAEASLAESVELHRFLADNASELLIRATADGTIVYASQASGCLLELDSGDLVGANIADIVDVSDRPVAAQILADAHTTGATASADVRLSTHAAGIHPWISLSAQSVVRGGDPVELHLSIRDVRERRAAEEALAQAEATQRLILEALSEAVVLHSETYGVLRANRAATEMLEIVEGAVAATDQIDPTIEMFEADGSLLDRADSPSQRASRSGQPERGRIIELRHPSRGSRWVAVDAVMVEQIIGGRVERFTLQTFIDITARRQAEEALAATERLQRLILDSLDEGVVLHGPDVGVVVANRAMTDKFGVCVGAGQLPDQIMRSITSFEPDGRLLDANDTPSRRAIGSGVAQKGRILRYEHNDGRSAWMRVDAYPLSPAAGSVSPVLMTFADITAQHDAARMLAASEERLRLVIESSRELITVVGNDGLITFSSPSTRDILGYEPDQTLGTPIGSYIDPQDFRTAVARLGTDGDRTSMRVRARHSDSSIVWLEALATVLTSGDGTRNGVLLSSRDITQRLDFERQLEAERQLLHATIHSIHAGVLAIDHNGIIVEVNAAFHEIAGTDFEPGRDFLELTDSYSILDEHGTLVPPAERPLSRALAGEHVNDEPCLLLRRDGYVRHVVASASPITDGGGHAGAVLTVHDVTELRAAEAELRGLATTDTLTGLPNRRTIIERLTHALARHQREPELVSVIFLDLDGFKAINDNLGHEAGDDLLIAAADRITATLRVGDIVGRHGGDEFVIIAEQITREDARALGVRIEAELAQPFLLPAGVAHIGGSAGLAHAHEGSTPESLLADADVAMYDTKRRHHALRDQLR